LGQVAAYVVAQLIGAMLGAFLGLSQRSFAATKDEGGKLACLAQVQLSEITILI
jgi:glycerol uptake facilitator-like aquaporin